MGVVKQQVTRSRKPSLELQSEKVIPRGNWFCAKARQHYLTCEFRNSAVFGTMSAAFGDGAQATGEEDRYVELNRSLVRMQASLNQLNSNLGTASRIAANTADMSKLFLAWMSRVNDVEASAPSMDE